MDEIVIKEKPDTISFDEIHNLLYRANEKNRKEGFVLNTSLLSGDELKKRLGERGRCFVALKDGKLIGTASVRVVKRSTWYAKGEIADYMLVGVLPEFQGKHISTLLERAVVTYVRELSMRAIELDTAENNRTAIQVYQHQGYHLVTYKKYAQCDHYSVVMVKWLSEMPYSKMYASFRFHTKRMLVRLKSGNKRMR